MDARAGATGTALSGNRRTDIWLEDLRADELIDGERLRVIAPPQARGWIEARFGRVVQSCVTTVLGPGVTLELLGDEHSDDRARPPFTPHGQRPGHHPRNRRAAAIGRPRRSQSRTKPKDDAGPRSRPLGNPKLSFDQFVIGDSNRLAHAAALTVAEMPAQAYNPLFICGPPGVGKTHLLNSIATLLTTHNRGLIVRCTTGEEFTNEFLGALSGGHADDFKASFRDLDVLLVDDVQFLRAQGEDRGGVLPHVQRPLRQRPADRAQLRPSTPRPAGARGPPARALRGRASSPTSSRPSSQPASRSCASARTTTASSSPTPVSWTRSPSASR